MFSKKKKSAEVLEEACKWSGWLWLRVHHSWSWSKFGLLCRLLYCLWLCVSTFSIVLALALVWSFCELLLGADLVESFFFLFGLFFSFFLFTAVGLASRQVTSLNWLLHACVGVSADARERIEMLSWYRKDGGQDCVNWLFVCLMGHRITSSGCGSTLPLSSQQWHDLRTSTQTLSSVSHCASTVFFVAASSSQQPLSPSPEPFPQLT